jgi:glutaredoxin
MHRATAELIASGAAERAAKVGDKAPAFSLKDPEGNEVSSVDLLSQGPLVVIFYRGVWCPYCNMDLQALHAALPQFEKYDAKLVAISPETAANSRRSMRENKLDFPDPVGSAQRRRGSLRPAIPRLPDRPLPEHLQE